MKIETPQSEKYNLHLFDAMVKLFVKKRSKSLILVDVFML